MNALFEAAVASDTALELNANWNRLDPRDIHLRSALQAGCKIAINTDTHHEMQMDFLVYGVLTTRRAGLEPEACINYLERREAPRWLRSKRP